MCAWGGGACVVYVQKQDNESMPLEVRIMLATGGASEARGGAGGLGTLSSMPTTWLCSLRVSALLCVYSISAESKMS